MGRKGGSDGDQSPWEEYVDLLRQIKEGHKAERARQLRERAQKLAGALRRRFERDLEKYPHVRPSRRVAA